jgi:hypothetical protein
MGNRSFISAVMWGNILNQNSDMNFWEEEIRGLYFSISKIFGFNRSTTRRIKKQFHCGITPRDSLFLFSIWSKYIGQEIMGSLTNFVEVKNSSD